MLAVIEAQNKLNLSHLLLKQKLNLDREHKLNLEPYDEKDLIALSSKVLKAQNLPEFQLSENRVLYQQTKLAQSKGVLMPKIFITGSLGSGYSENNTFVLEGGTFSPKSLGSHLDENLYKSVIMTLSIPILNEFNRTLNIQRNKLALERARSNRQQMSNEVANKLEQMNMDVNGGYTKYEALQATLDFYQVALDLASAKYDEGMIDLYDLEDARNKLLRVEIDLLKSKYELFLVLETRNVFEEFSNSNL